MAGRLGATQAPLPKFEELKLEAMIVGFDGMARFTISDDNGPLRGIIKRLTKPGCITCGDYIDALKELKDWYKHGDSSPLRASKSNV